MIKMIFKLQTNFHPGNTALLAALLYKSSEDILNLLTEKDIDTSYNYDGNSPLHVASHSGFSNFIKSN